MRCLLTTCSQVQVVVGAAVVGAVYAGLAYFNKDKDVQDSLERFGHNVKNDARGEPSFRRLLLDSVQVIHFAKVQAGHVSLSTWLRLVLLQVWTAICKPMGVTSGLGQITRLEILASGDVKHIFR